jgi:hypothetical protein
MPQQLQPEDIRVSLYNDMNEVVDYNTTIERKLVLLPSINNNLKSLESKLQEDLLLANSLQIPLEPFRAWREFEDNINNEAILNQLLDPTPPPL